MLEQVEGSRSGDVGTIQNKLSRYHDRARCGALPFGGRIGVTGKHLLGLQARRELHVQFLLPARAELHAVGA